MHLLYIDDSGSVGNPDEAFFILGGVAIFERRLFHLVTAVDEVVRGFNLGDPHDIELHASPMYSGHGLWHSIARADREKMLHAALGTILDPQTSLRLFAVAVDKRAISPRDPVAVAFEEISNRFNLSLQRLNDRGPGESQKGLIIMDESDYEGPLQALARHFRINGTRWGHLRNLAEVPLFVDSKASRLVQLADLVAWATWRKYEHKDGRFFDRLTPRFDADGGVIHGLVHHHSPSEQCFCPACATRASRARPTPSRPVPYPRNSS